jgi:hypothetical protein
MDEELEATLKELPERGHIEEILRDDHGFPDHRISLRLNQKEINVSHAHIAVSDTSEDIYYHKKFRERVPLTARRFLAFVVGRFSDREKKEYLGYAKYLGKPDGSSIEEICLVPMESVEDYFALTEGMKVVTY